MAFAITYHPEVKDDVVAIDQAVRHRIRTAIHSRLTSNPAVYGKPLRGTLAGLWKLRVGDWRVVYTIEGNTVLIIGIMHRSRVYQEVRDRL